MSMDPQQPHQQPPPGPQPRPGPGPYGSPPGLQPPPYGPAHGTPPPAQRRQQYAVPAHIPPGWPGRQQRTPQPVFDPGRFRWMDLVTVLAYIGIFVLGLAVLVTFIPGFMALFTDESGQPDAAVTGFAVNAIAYLVLTALALIACWRPFVDSFRTFRHHGWLKVGLIPAIWLGTIIVNALIVLSAGEPIQSENQLALEEMTLGVPFLPMMIVVVLMGPFVEEYIFRHLLIGKLSRYVNVWICVPVSIVIFALIHFIGTGFNFNPIEMLPYLTLSTAITLAYVLTGKSLAYAYIIHVVNNLIALSLAYLLLPLMS